MGLITKNIDNTFRLLFVSHEASVNGSTASLISLIKGLREVAPNIESEVILPFSFRGNAKRELRKNDIKYKVLLYKHNYFYLTKPKKIRGYIYDLMNVLAVRYLCIYAKTKSIAIMCSNSTAVDIGARAALIAKVPHIFYIREFMEEDHGFSYRNKARMKKLLEGSESAVFISKSIEKRYTSLYLLRNTSQFFDGFIIEDYYMPASNAFRAEKISFIQIGRLSEGKGALDTIRLLNNINQNGIADWSMEFVGDGDKEYLHTMKKLIADCHLENQIFISGYCDHVKDKLAKKDILIMNSRAEGFGRVTIEAMLAGCLVIGRGGSGTSEIVIDGVNGLIFEGEEQFTQIIRDILKDRMKYKIMALNGQKYAVNEFRYVNTANEFMRVVKDTYRNTKGYEGNRE